MIYNDIAKAFICHTFDETTIKLFLRIGHDIILCDPWGYLTRFRLCPEATVYLTMDYIIESFGSIKFNPIIVAHDYYLLNQKSTYIPLYAVKYA